MYSDGTETFILLGFVNMMETFEISNWAESNALKCWTNNLKEESPAFQIIDHKTNLNFLAIVIPLNNFILKKILTQYTKQKIDLPYHPQSIYTSQLQFSKKPEMTIIHSIMVIQFVIQQQSLLMDLHCVGLHSKRVYLII